MKQLVANRGIIVFRSSIQKTKPTWAKRRLNMLVHRWKKPLVIKEDGLQFVVGSPEEAINWLDHQPEKATVKWKRAWDACKAVVEERLKTEQARSAVASAMGR